MTEVDPDGPFGDLRRALRRLPDDQQDEASRSGMLVRVDPNRQRRTGIPEVVHAQNKPPSDVADALRRLVAAHGGRGRVGAVGVVGHQHAPPRAVAPRQVVRADH